MRKQVADLEEELARLRKEYEKHETDVTKAKELLKSTEDEMQKWLVSISKLHLHKITVLGDSIIEAALVTFFSNLDVNNRNKIGNRLIDLLDEYHIEHTKYNDILNFGDTSLSDYDNLLWECHKLPQGNIYKQNAAIYHIMKKIKIPTVIIYDKEGIVFNFIKSVEKNCIFLIIF